MSKKKNKPYSIPAVLIDMPLVEAEVETNPLAADDELEGMFAEREDSGEEITAEFQDEELLPPTEEKIEELVGETTKVRTFKGFDLEGNPVYSK